MTRGYLEREIFEIISQFLEYDEERNLIEVDPNVTSAILALLVKYGWKDPGEYNGEAAGGSQAAEVTLEWRMKNED